jgi:hypothetical protein
MRLYLKLNESETRAISALASKEYRDIPSQAVFIIRQALERRGLLPKEEIKQQEIKARSEGQQ